MVSVFIYLDAMKVIVIKEISVLMPVNSVLVKKGKDFILQGYQKGYKEVIRKTTDPETGKVTEETFETPTFYHRDLVKEMKQYFKVLR